MSNIAELLKIKVSGKDGETTGPLADIKLLALYFSAHWCPPCRGFTPKLAQCYDAVNSTGKKFEVVFVSFDRTSKGFDDYYKDMPWLTMTYEDEDGRSRMASEHGVKGIPALIFIDPSNGKVITKDGRDKVEKDLNGTNFPWTG